MPGFAVDEHPQKHRIVKELIAGRPVRHIADSLVPPVPFSAIQRYKTNVIKPMLARAEAENRILNGNSAQLVPFVPLTPDKQAAQAVQQSIQDAPVLSLFRQGLEDLRVRIGKNLDKAESNDKFFGVIPALANQAHKNLEILGRATGELESTGTGVSIQIVCPWAPDKDKMPRVSFAAGNGEVEFEATDVFQDIGTVQKS